MERIDRGFRVGLTKSVRAVAPGQFEQGLRVRINQEHADRADFRAIGRVIAPWGRRIGDMRFETDSAWKRSGSGIDQLVKELRLALQYPEGAAF